MAPIHPLPHCACVFVVSLTKLWRLLPPHESRLVCDLLSPKECGRRGTVSVWVFERSWKPEVCHNTKYLVWLSWDHHGVRKPKPSLPHGGPSVERGSLILAEKPGTWAIKASLLFQLKPIPWGTGDPGQLSPVEMAELWELPHCCFKSLNSVFPKWLVSHPITGLYIPFFFFPLHTMPPEILIPQPETGTQAVKAQRPNHWPPGNSHKLLNSGTNCYLAKEQNRNIMWIPSRCNNWISKDKREGMLLLFFASTLQKFKYH